MKKRFDEGFIKLIEKEKQKDFEKNLVEAILSVSWYYKKDVDEVLEMSYPRFDLMAKHIKTFQNFVAVVQANQIGKLMGGKGSSGIKTFG